MSAVIKKIKPLYNPGDLVYVKGYPKFIEVKIDSISKIDTFMGEVSIEYEGTVTENDAAAWVFENQIVGPVPKIPHNPKAPKSGRLMR